ncbi:MAG: glutamate--tRNA ligase [Helicobacter sp.]|nr:glutamate--tRNA ligase [Helicobacter sp.]
MKQVVTRFAPSPTGFLHIGGLRTALFNYLFARKNHGKFLLRIEDTDLARNSDQAAKAIIQSFEWAGLDFDGEVFYQSKRFDIYKKYITKLLDEDKAYFCYMTKEELDALRTQQIEAKQTPRYDGRYRDFKGTPPPGISPVVRIKAPKSGQIQFKDGIKGDMNFEACDVDDFIIARSDGSPTYNFTVAIDDALMGITHVLRGDDHLSNTPKQIVIYNALDFEVPAFYHIPMILGEDGAKLSKRHGALGVMEYQKMGFLKEALLNFLVRLGWSYGDKELFSMSEMLEFFNPSEINSSASRFNKDKLLWINESYLKEIKTLDFEALLGEFLNDKNMLKKLSFEQKELLFDSIKQRAKTLKDAAELVENTLILPLNYDSKMYTKLDANKKQILEKFKLKDFADLADLKAQINDFVVQNELKNSDLMPFLRLALSGKSGGIGVAEHIFIIGLAEANARIKRLLTQH